MTAKMKKETMTEKGKNLRIAQSLKERILSGGYPIGSKLEPLSELTKQFNATVVTMSRALDILENEGLIERVNGLGIFVKEQVKHRFVVVFDSKAEMGLFAHKAVFMRYFIDYCHENGYEYKVFEDVDTVRDCNRIRRYLRDNACDTILISSRAFAVGSEKYLQGIPIAAIGLYAYKDLKTTIHSDTRWTQEAYQYLLECGCSKIALITNQDQIHLWQNPEIITQEEIYDSMCAQNPDIFDFSMFCQSELSPRGGYIKTCSLLEKISSEEKIGIVVTDAVLTHGVISAILQKQYNLGKNLFLISHALNGFNLSQFSIPVITYQLDIKKDIELIDSMIKEYQATKKLKTGVSMISGKLHFPKD